MVKFVICKSLLPSCSKTCCLLKRDHIWSKFPYYLWSQSSQLRSSVFWG